MREGLLKTVLMWLWLSMASVNIASAAAPQLVTPSLPNAMINVPYSAKLMISSMTTGSVGANLAGLPPGLSFTHSVGNIVISGTPTAAGSFPIAVTANNPDGTLNVNAPFRVDQFATNVTAIAAGSGHTCVVVGGGVQCWGGNANGQLGNNSTAASNVAVRAITPGSNATAVSAGGSHSCAVVAGGLQCWGANGNGQLGNNSNAQSLVPVAIFAAGSNVTAVAAGNGHTCAVINGGVQCWGQNFAGQLGNNSNVSSLIPVTAIAPLSGATAVATGGSHTCAAVNGGVRCWGANGFGTLGNAGTGNSFVPVTAIAAGSGATAVALGSNHSCAIVAGRVHCWGQNNVGQLSFGNAVETSPILVANVPAGSTMLAAGTFHNCANAPDGVYCWGSNSTKQVGIDRAPYNVFPALTLANGGGIAGVAAGAAHSCAITNGGVQCWGSPGMLGTAATNFAAAPVATIDAGTGTAVVDGGYDHTCATVSSVSVLCWGENESGQLGNGASTASIVPVASAVASGSIGSSVGAWNAHTCAVISAGVQCWGYNIFGQLGNGGNALSRVPVVAIAANSSINMVTTGDFHSCALTAAGGVRCWGYNLYGQLGNGGNTSSNVPVVALPDGSGATFVSARGMHTCAVVGGGVKCWGRNLNGQLGNNSFVDSNIAVTAFAAGSGATAVSAGGNHSCAVVSGGVRCWGLNFFGQLGDNSTSLSAVPVVALPNNSFATYISAGLEHSCAVVSSGVQCWGRNHLGQLGNRSTTQSQVPVVAIVANSGLFSVTAGVEHTCAGGNGGVVCWGSNDLGQLVNPASYPLRKVYAAIPLPTVPGAPTITGAVGGPGTATLSFIAPASDGGLPIMSYSATCTASSLPTRSATASSNATSITVSGMTGNVQYNCTMTATNGAGTGAASAGINVAPGVAPIELQAVFSRKTHGAQGNFDLPIDRAAPVNGAVTIESRAIGNGHRIVFQFNNPIFQLGSVTVTDSNSQSIGSAALSPNGNEVIATLTGIPDRRRVKVTLANVNGSGSGSVSLGFLVGDVDGDRTVNTNDLSGVKTRAGQASVMANFRFDLNATGVIGAADIVAVKARPGSLLP